MILSTAESLASLPEAQRKEILASLTDAQHEELLWDWEFWARQAQKEPAGDWLTWLILAGRGYGKTRVGAETIRRWACGKTPLARGRYRRFLLIAETAADARDVMVEGESGILSVHPREFRPLYEPSKRRLTWPNGATASLFNATEPDQLRGPQGDAAWSDELAKWQYARETWDMLQFGLRLGDNPRQIVTTTPRPISVIKELLADDTTVVTRGTTMENRGNLAPSFLRKIQSRYEGTRLGRQELNAEVLDDNPNALWTRGMIEAALIKVCPVELARIVVAVDPSGTDGQEEGDDIGIVAAGRGVDGIMYVLEDATCQLSPAGWGGVTVSLYNKIGADRVVGERNFGGAMVKHVIHTADPGTAYKEVIASRGKWLRAEPIAALYEQGRVKHIGSLPKLEDELCAFGPDGLADGKSPNRLDALVWAGTELMLGGEIMVFGAAEADIIVDAFDIPVTWPRVFVVEVGKDRVGVVWGAVNRDTDTVYLYNEYAAQRGDMAILAAAVRDRQPWIPGVMNLVGKDRPKDETRTIADRLEALKLNLSLVDVDMDGATEKTSARLGSQRLKVFRHLSGWIRQYRNYCQDDKGKIVTTDDGLMTATILLCAEGIDNAALKAKPFKDKSGSQRSAWGV